MIEIYTKDYCPYCHRAKALLDRKGVNYTEYDVTRNPELEKEMRQRARAFTVPQIFVNGLGIGGSDDLMHLEHQGKLDALLVNAIAVNG